MNGMNRRMGRRQLAGLLIVVLVALRGIAGAELSAMAGGGPAGTAGSQNAVQAGTATPDSWDDTEADEPASGSDMLENDLQQASPSNLLRTGKTGDLWDGWKGDMDFPGEGTKARPYQIGGLAQLMGLSEAVAAGNDFEGTYFELTGDIDMGGIEVNYGSWNPVGWYQNGEELAGEVIHPFRGHFDGGGNRISGLSIQRPGTELRNIGLFGVIEDGSVCNLTIEADDIYGSDNAAVLAGSVLGESRIYNVQVSGYVYADGDTGGIAAEVRGDRAEDGSRGQAVIENCRAEGIILNSTGADCGVGGIAGDVQRACLIDNTVITQNGDYNRIQGKGYVGGIAGRMRETSIYNSYVNGTVGGNGSRAAGGIVGKYESGNLILARMAGDIGRTNNGSGSREGTFVGTRDSRHNFTYGTERDSRLSYLYTNSASKARQVFGSKIDGDNSFSGSAHIGFWTDLERKYAVLDGRIEEDCKDRYFYEELEDGVRYIVTQKLGREFTAEEYARELPFRPDHFAPGYMGEPAAGYLVSVPRIDAKNANGTFDANVAVLTAIPETGSSYYRTIDLDHPAAVTPGAVVAVTTAPRNTEKDRYQMKAAASESGGVKPPVYVDEEGQEVPMQYTGGGGYTFIMPECDTVLKAEYVKVTTRLTVDPAETVIHVIMTRSGDRKHPSVVTEVKNNEGILIARYIENEPDQSVEVQPVLIHAEHNGTGQTADRRVLWSVDDPDLLMNQSDTGYTLKDGRILPNLKSSFIQGIIRQETRAQADNQYREPIRGTVHTRYAVVTAAAHPDTSADRETVYGNCRAAVQFRIVDNTTLRVEGMELDRKELTMTITRRLTGSRQKPQETITCSVPVVLTAFLNPRQPFLKQVSWQAQNGGILSLTPSGDNMQDCRLAVQYDPSGQGNPAWIQNIINADDAKKKASPGEKLNGSGTAVETVTATSEDQTYGVITASCQVTVQFVTVDETTVRSSSGGGGGGGGSRSAAGSSTAGGPGTAAETSLPEYVVTGAWTQTPDGRWRFADSRRAYAKEWAAIYNPYADTAAGQSSFNWFYFDQEGIMATGWFTDADGSQYYLNPSPDGTQGRMYTGWNWIDGCLYYFNEMPDGTRGALKRNFTAPDGRKTNENGVWEA